MDHVPPLFRVSCTPLPRGTEAAALALLSSAADFVMDVRFLAGALLGWRVLAAIFGGQRRRAPACRRSKAQRGQVHSAALQNLGFGLEAELAEARRLLADATAAARRAQRQLDGERNDGKQTEGGPRSPASWEAGHLRTLPAAPPRQPRGGSDGTAAPPSPGTVQALAADNARLLAECEAALLQLQGLAASLQQQRQPRQADARGAAQRRREAAAAARAPEPAGGAQPEAEQLRRELEEVRAQLAAALRENGELEERLLQVAFESLSPTSEGAAAFSPPRGGIPLGEHQDLQRLAASTSPAQKALFDLEPAQQRNNHTDAGSPPAGSPARPPLAAASPANSRPRSGGRLRGTLARLKQQKEPQEDAQLQQQPRLVQAEQATGTPLAVPQARAGERR